MRVLVTGSAGRIESYVVRDLVAAHLGGLGQCRRCAGSADVRRECPRHLSHMKACAELDEGRVARPLSVMDQMAQALTDALN